MRKWAVCSALMLAAGAAIAQEGEAQPEGYIEKLIQALTADDSYKVRLQAAVFLGRSDDDRAVEPLIRVLTADEHYTVRAAAATALANLEEPRAISHIVRAAALDPDTFVREEAGRALRKYDREEVLPYVVATYGSEDARVRREVVSYLAEGPFDAAEIVFVRALGDTPEIYDIAKTAVVGLQDPPKLRFLSAAVEHRDAGVRRGAIQILHALGTKEATDVILKVYERDIEVDQVRSATREALRDLRRFLPVEQIVTSAVNDSDKHARARSIKLLGVIGGADAHKALLTTLADEEIYLRGTAVMALRELGDPDAIEPLEKLLQDPANQRIALQIRTAVKHLKKHQGTTTN
jgi:HEAT repeat protein